MMPPDAQGTPEPGRPGPSASCRTTSPSGRRDGNLPCLTSSVTAGWSREVTETLSASARRAAYGRPQGTRCPPAEVHRRRGGQDRLRGLGDARGRAGGYRGLRLADEQDRAAVVQAAPTGLERYCPVSRYQAVTPGCRTGCRTSAC